MTLEPDRAPAADTLPPADAAAGTAPPTGQTAAGAPSLNPDRVRAPAKRARRRCPCGVLLRDQGPYCSPACREVAQMPEAIAIAQAAAQAVGLGEPRLDPQQAADHLAQAAAAAGMDLGTAQALLRQRWRWRWEIAR